MAKDTTVSVLLDRIEDLNRQLNKSELKNERLQQILAEIRAERARPNVAVFTHDQLMNLMNFIASVTEQVMNRDVAEDQDYVN